MKTVPCVGWPEQPCAWDRCLRAGHCQNPGGPTGADYAVEVDGDTAVFIEADGARIVSVEIVEEP